MEFKRIIGIDVSKNILELAWYDQAKQLQHLQCKNTLVGLSQLIKSLTRDGLKMEEILFCMESTGHYSDLSSRILSHEGAFVWVAHPLILKTCSPTLVRGKDDKTDAKKLCEFATAFTDMAVRFTPTSEQEEKLKDLDRLRTQLVRFSTQLSNMIASNADKAMPCALTNMLLNNLLEQIKAALKQVDNELKTAILADPKTRRIYQILLSVPCIGPVCATQLIILTRSFAKFSDYKAFACYISTAPFVKSSGKYKSKPKVHKCGHKEFKGKLYIATLSQIHPGRFFRGFYEYGTETLKKHHNSVMNALMNEVIKIAFHLVKTDQLFDKELYLSNKKNKPKFLQVS